MAETTNQSDPRPAETSKLVGLLAQFDDPDTLVRACDQAREHGYKKMDAYSPFPVHGIDPAIGIKRTILPFIVLAVGLGAVLAGLGIQFYANNDVSTFGFFPGYPFMISGKPYFSVPANMPVLFEIIVLSSAFAAFLGMWILNKLPMFSNPLHRISRFRRATNDRFFLMIEEGDENFDRAGTEAQLNGWGASAIEECRQDLTDTEMPTFVKVAAILGFCLLLAPPILIYRAAGMTNRYPRLHVVPDMDWQEKYKAQSVGPNLGTVKSPEFLFEDIRSARRPIEGTIARGNLQIDSEYYRGIKSGSSVAVSMPTEVRTSLQDDAATQDPAKPAAPAEPNWITSFPKQVVVDEALLKRGQQRFNIYCTVCHGYAGNGDGQVNTRALALAVNGQANWTTAKSFHDPTVIEQPVGRLFDTITHGRATMGPYGDQIPVEDRWAIVAYVRALQATGIKPPTVDDEEKPATDIKPKP